LSAGNPITAVFSIPATRPGYSEYFVSTSPTSYHSPSWMSYPPEPEDVPPQWADSVRKPIVLAYEPTDEYSGEIQFCSPFQALVSVSKTSEC